MTICRLLVVLVVVSATPASAQSAYITAAAGREFSRLSNVEVTTVQNLHHGGDADAVTLRAGTRIGSNWGVEIGFTRPFPVEVDRAFGYPVSLLNVTGDDPVSVIAFLETRNQYRRRDDTLETAAWVAQRVADRLDLVYLAGVAFNRTTESIRYASTRRVSGVVVPFEAHSEIYGLTPIGGFDARIAITSHIRLVPGVRLQGIGAAASSPGGWVIRPSAGLMFAF